MVVTYGDVLAVLLAGAAVTAAAYWIGYTMGRRR